jgi:UDP-glucose 4-epimerase
MKKNVLVTGGAGYIGSHACKALFLAGYIPITVDSLITGWEDSVKYGPFEKVDLLDNNKLEEVFKKYHPVAVLHFAALSQVGESYQNPGLYWRNNVLGSLNLIETSVKYQCLDFIFSSTCATYGNHDNVVLNEETEQLPTNAYGSSKRSIEEIIKQFSQASSLRYVIFRYFNVAGADSDAEIGELHKPETHLIPLLFDALTDKSDPIKIYGTDYETKDGTCIRDYVHVCDLVDAHVLGLKWLQETGHNRIYNLGSGRGYSVREVINQVEIVTNKTVPYINGERRLGDCTKLVSGSNLARLELGWNPSKSSLSKMILDAWRWYKNVNNLK